MPTLEKPHLMKQEGGLKTLPDFVEIDADNTLAKITVITVVFNSVKFIERTIQSVINQSYPNIEYIVVDGGSTDGTVDLLWKYNDYIDYWVSEADNGLYHAMNKALELGQGDYVWFMNAGDEIYDLTTLDSIFRDNKQLAEVYYGETMVVDTNSQEIGMRRLSIPEKLTWKSLKYGMLVSHQAFIVSAKLAFNYNTDYRFSADYDWMLRVLRNAKKIENTSHILTKFMDGGMTKQNIKAGLKERFSIMRKNYGVFRTLFNHIFMSVRFTTFVAKHGRF